MPGTSVALNTLPRRDIVVGSSVKRQRLLLHYLTKFTKKEGFPMPGYRFGKHPPKVDYRTLRFENYLKAGLLRHQRLTMFDK